MPPLNTNSPTGAPAADTVTKERLALRRRDALKLFASGLALTLAGCSRPREEIVPYVDMPERMVAGEPEYYATAFPLAGFARGVLVKSIDGRPIKVEGNPRHPASLGSTDIFAQAEILSLYDPDRSGTVRGATPVATWSAFETALKPRLAALSKRQGAGLSFLTGRITSPTLKRQIAALLERYPQALWHAYEPGEGDLARRSQTLQRPRLDARVIVSLDADPLGPGPEQIVNAREFAKGRAPAHGSVSRLYALESARTLTGANADHRLSLAPADLERFAQALAERLAAGEATDVSPPPGTQRLFEAIVRDVSEAGGQAVLLAGDTLSAPARAAIGRTNQRLGARFAETLAVDGPRPVPLGDFFAGVEDGSVSDLIVLGRNPVYDLPDEKLAAALEKIPFSVHAGTHENETSRLTRWHLPQSHVLESWSDLGTAEGTVSIVQPLIRPLYETRSIHEIMALLTGDPAPSGHAIVRQTWQTIHAAGDFETWWRDALIAGVVPEADSRQAPARSAPETPLSPEGPPEAQPAASAQEATDGGFAAVIRPDPTIHDGSFANNAWLQECPKPISKNTWSNAVTLSSADAARLGASSGDVVVVESAEGGIEGPAHVDAGQADGLVGLTLGYGRTASGAIGTGLGYNARKLSPRRFASLIPAVSVSVTDRRDPVPSTQEHFKLEGDLERLLPLVTPETNFEIDDDNRPADGEHFNNPERPSDGYSWAMVIDSAACIGCNACVVACQSENNIAVVGPEEVANNRIMQWIRVDRYERAESPASVAGFEPVPCMQCEKAPCEPVCPVEASVHDIEGINNQVYNRCVGTRFCQSNCPYKVRRFNWYAYNSGQEYENLGADPMPAQKNPDVTVRARGVMEKCTYCVQRISRARRNAEKTDERIADGGVVTACQQACPTQAIHFGNLEDDASEVSTLRDDPRHFTLLEELGTAPRTTYLARLRNANPHLGGDDT